MKLFKNFAILTIISIYLLILVGGIVRSTGSGMGCPDWPKCFGQWIPPTQENELPDNYKEVYREKRIAKNERFAKLLDKLGFTDLSFKITKDENVLKEEDFNATKTWIEYLNRVLGVLIGFFIFLTFVFSLPYRKTHKKLVVLTFAAFVLVGIEGFIGSIVVSTNLLPALITVHMLLAIGIVMLLIYALTLIPDTQSNTINSVSFVQTNTKTDKYKIVLLEKVLLVSIVTSIIQITLGTQIREAIDVIAMQLADRNLWIDQLGLSFYMHRSFSLVILALHSYIVFLLFKETSLMKSWAYLLLCFVITEVLTGVIMAYFAIPAFVQPIHLVLSTVIVGLQFWLWKKIS
jgi:cytochrome c oxidase assembly protein subunit 15